MLPHSYALPAALLLLVGGAVSCFAGYRLFRIVLAIYGFILGASIASSMMGVTNTGGMLLAALLGGIAGALVAHVLWGYFGSGDPPALLLIVLAVLGAIGAMLLQRYVIVVSTAFGGAWTLVIGALAVLGNRAATSAARGGDVWILYPMTPGPGQPWVPVAWVVLGLIGVAVQLGVTARQP